MTSSERLCAIDLGTSKVRYMTAECTAGRIENIVSYGQMQSNGVRDGVVVDVEDSAASIGPALSSAGEFDRVIINISGPHIASLNSVSVLAVTRTGRRISQEDVWRLTEQAKVIVLPPEREIIHCIPRTFRLDGQEGVRRPAGMYGNRLEIEAHVVTANRSHTQNLAAALGFSGPSASTMVLSALAAAHSVLTAKELSQGCILVDIGAGVADIAIFADGSVRYSSVVANGGQAIADELGSALNITKLNAKHLMHEYSRPKAIAGGIRPECPQSAISEIVAVRLEYMFSHVRDELIKSGCYGLLSSGVILTGGISNLCGIEEAAKRVLKMPVRVGVPTLTEAAPIELRRPEYSVLLGLCSYGAANSTGNYRPSNGLQRFRELLSRWAFFSKP